MDQQQKLQGYDPRKRILEDTFNESNPVEQFGIGLANSGLETWEGAKQLLGLEGPETEERLRVARDTPTSIPGMAGYLTGEVAQVAGPAGVLAKVSKAPALAEGVASTLQGGLKGVPEGESALAHRMTNAGLGAAGGLAGRALGGVSPTGQASDLMARAKDLDVPMRLTPGQMGGDIWQRSEQGLEALPIIGSTIRAHQRMGLRDWNRLLLNEVSPDGNIADYGAKGLRGVNRQFSEGYDSVIAAAPDVLQQTRTGAAALATAIDTFIPKLKPDAATEFAKQAKRLAAELSRGSIPREAFKQTKGEFDSMAEEAFRNGGVLLGKAYKALSNTVSAVFKEHLPPDVAARLDLLDSKYGEFLPVVRAQALKGATKEDLITPNQLLSAIRAEDPSLRKKGFALQERPLEAETLRAEESLGRAVPNMGPGTAEKLFTGGALYSAAMDPGTALPIGGGLVGASGLMTAAAPVLRGSLPGQRAFREAANYVPGVTSQLGEAGLGYPYGERSSLTDELRSLTPARQAEILSRLLGR